MIAVAVVLAGTVAVLAVVVGALVLQHQRERNGWVAERRRLVDRAIARHSGEVIAFDRQANQDVATETEREPRPFIEGLS